MLDLGCGIGGDLLALAQRRRVVAYELDPVRAAFSQANAAAMGLGGQVEVRTGDWVADLHAGLLPPAAGAFADPARRVDERRVFRLDQLQPPIAPLLELQAVVPALGVKVMPSVQDSELPPGCGVEFVSHQRVCKEAVLWFGPATWRRRWAAVVTGDGAAYIPSDDEAPPLGALAPGQVLYEPDPALIRAGCLAGCAGACTHTSLTRTSPTWWGCRAGPPARAARHSPTHLPSRSAPIRPETAQPAAAGVGCRPASS